MKLPEVNKAKKNHKTHLTCMSVLLLLYVPLFVLLDLQRSTASLGFIY